MLAALEMAMPVGQSTTLVRISTTISWTAIKFSTDIHVPAFSSKQRHRAANIGTLVHKYSPIFPAHISLAILKFGDFHFKIVS